MELNMNQALSPPPPISLLCRTWRHDENRYNFDRMLPTLHFRADRIFYEGHMKYFRISLQSNGDILWHPGGIYRTSCPLTVTYFPFDTQVKTFFSQQIREW